ncbi:MAG: LicD family protein [Oscillospiraceae bacterium]|nr:LicD family protein [Oscillospiraceae bacterium]
MSFLNKIRALFETNVMFRQIITNNKDIQFITEEETAKFQKVLLQMMKDIHFVCEKHSLTYFLGGGSCLGAVRHKGFIPWDDDIDVIMPREDYDKFTSLLSAEFPDKYFYEEIRINEKYDANFMKIRLKGSVCREIFESDPENAGIFIDINPLENVYDNSILRKIHGYFCELLLLITSCVRLKNTAPKIMPYITDKKQLDVIKRKLRLGKLLSFFSLRKWLLITEKRMCVCKNKNSSFVSIPTGRKHYFGEMQPRSTFSKAVLTDFEDTKFYIMEDFNSYLTGLFGEDYMTPPPKESRERHAVTALKFPENI